MKKVFLLFSSAILPIVFLLSFSGLTRVAKADTKSSGDCGFAGGIGQPAYSSYVKADTTAQPGTYNNIHIEVFDNNESRWNAWSGTAHLEAIDPTNNRVVQDIGSLAKGTCTPQGTGVKCETYMSGAVLVPPPSIQSLRVTSGGAFPFNSGSCAVANLAAGQVSCPGAVCGSDNDCATNCSGNPSDFYCRKGQGGQPNTCETKVMCSTNPLNADDCTIDPANGAESCHQCSNFAPLYCQNHKCIVTTQACSDPNHPQACVNGGCAFCIDAYKYTCEGYRPPPGGSAGTCVLQQQFQLNSVNFPNPLDPSGLIQAIITLLIPVAILISVLRALEGLYKIMTSQGNEQVLMEGKEILGSAFAALVLSLIGLSVLNTIIKALFAP